MKVLFLGGTSYLGQEIIKCLKGVEITLVGRETKLEDIEKLPEQDIVMNLVVDYGRNNKSTEELIEINVDYPFERIKKLKFKTLINFSTALEKSVSPYALSKKMLEEKLLILADESGRQVINLHIQQFYGPGTPEHNFVSFLLTKMKTNGPIPLTDGQQKRDFIFIEDLLNAVCVLVEKRSLLGLKETIDIGSGESVRVQEFVCEMKRITGSLSELQFGAIPRRMTEPEELKANISKLKKLGWEPKISFEEGLERLISWHLTQK